MFDLHHHNLYPLEVCEMFVITSIKVMGVKLHFTKSIFSTSTIHIEPTTVLNDAGEMPFHVITNAGSISANVSG